MSLGENLLILHLFGVLVLVGGHTAAAAAGIAMSRTARTRQIRALADLSLTAERLLITPGTLLTVGFGSWLVSETAFEFSDAWLIAAYALIALAVVVGAAVLGPHSRRVRERAGKLLADGIEESDGLRREAGAPLAVAAGNLETLIILVFIYLMVAKPGA